MKKFVDLHNKFSLTEYKDISPAVIGSDGAQLQQVLQEANCVPYDDMNTNLGATDVNTAIQKLYEKIRNKNLSNKHLYPLTYINNTNINTSTFLEVDDVNNDINYGYVIPHISRIFTISLNFRIGLVSDLVLPNRRLTLELYKNGELVETFVDDQFNILDFNNNVVSVIKLDEPLDVNPDDIFSVRITGLIFFEEEEPDVQFTTSITNLICNVWIESTEIEPGVEIYEEPDNGVFNVQASNTVVNETNNNTVSFTLTNSLGLPYIYYYEILLNDNITEDDFITPTTGTNITGINNVVNVTINPDSQLEGDEIFTIKFWDSPLRYLEYGSFDIKIEDTSI